MKARQDLDRFLDDRNLERREGETEEAFARRSFETLYGLTSRCRRASIAFRGAASEGRNLQAVPSNLLSSQFPEADENKRQVIVAAECEAAMHGTDMAKIESWVLSETSSPSEESHERSCASDLTLTSVAFGESQSTTGEERWSKKIQAHQAQMVQNLKDVVENWPPAPEITAEAPASPRPDSVLLVNDEVGFTEESECCQAVSPGGR